eukprot:6189051-Pleurochrysis_carterae.AAC.3
MACESTGVASFTVHMLPHSQLGMNKGWFCPNFIAQRTQSAIEPSFQYTARSPLRPCRTEPPKQRSAVYIGRAHFVNSASEHRLNSSRLGPEAE